MLDMNYINSLPQPFIGVTLSGGKWPVYDIEVDCGFVRIDVCGLLEVKCISDFSVFIDDSGVKHASCAFYADANEEERAPVA